MRLWNRLHASVRFWRYRLKSERAEIAYVLRQDLRGSTVIDIGAHRGAYTYWLNQAVGPQGRVLAFEPQPELVQYLHDVKRAFRLDRVTIVGSALSDECGERMLIRPNNHWGGGSFHIPANAPNREVFSVPTTTLDEFCAQHSIQNVRFIKCDAQDHEFHIFAGARELLRTQRPTLLFEQTHEIAATNKIAPMLHELGYRGYFFHRSELTPAERLPELRSQINARYFLNYVYRVDERDRLAA